MELKDIIAIAWKRRLIIVAVTVAAVVVAAAIALLSTKTYESTSTLVLTPNTSRDAGLVGSDNLTTLLPTYAAIAQSTSTQNRAQTLLGHPLDATVSAGSTAGTGILRISATSTSPAAAAAAAGAVSSAFKSAVNNKLLTTQVVGPATVPTSPVSPKKTLIIGAGLILGIALGFALALGLDRWFDRVASAGDIVSATGLACLGHVPRTPAMQGGGENSLIWRGDPELFGTEEAIRSLRTTLQLSMGTDAQVVQVTSPSAGEGKSTIAANLAVAIASLGIPTTLVDADFWAPRQHVMFGVSNARGLAVAIQDCQRHGENGSSRTVGQLLRTNFENLNVLPTGPVPERPTETIATWIQPVLDRLRETGRVIILDTPPVLPVSDARLIAVHADLVVVIAAAERTKSSVLRLAVEQLQAGQSNVAGVVLNDVRRMPPDQYGYGYGYARRPTVPLAQPDRAAGERDRSVIVRDRPRGERESASAAHDRSEAPAGEPLRDRSRTADPRERSTSEQSTSARDR